MKNQLLLPLLITLWACETTTHTVPQFEGDRVEVSDPGVTLWGIKSTEYGEDYNAAFELIEDHDFDGALAIYENLLLIEADSLLPTVHIYIGSTYQLMGENEKSLASNLTALELAPENSLANHAVGGSYYVLGDYPKAITYNQKALAIDPACPDCHYVLAASYRLLGQDSLAVVHAQFFLDQLPTSGLASYMQAIVDRGWH